MPVSLMSIWRAVTPCSGARDLEVHITQVIFQALDIREDGVCAGLVGDESHGDSGDRGLDRHARVH